jgi:carbamoyltransferase
VPISTRQFLRSRGSSILEILNIPRQIAETYRFIRSAGGDLTGLSKKRISREIHRRLNSTTVSSFSGDIFFIPHHKSHAASAYRCNDYDESIVITADGGGEHDCTVVWSSKLNRLKEFTRDNSIGHFYSNSAEYLGYTEPSGNRHAGKVMGLSSYGSYRQEFNEIFAELTSTNALGYDVEEFVDLNIEELESYFGARHHFPDEFKKHHKDFAFHLQKRTEELVIHLVKEWTEQTNIQNLSVAGGVFLNCKLNKKIAELDCIDELFIQPAANDSGASIGAGLEAYFQEESLNPVESLETVYLGPEYDNNRVKQVLDDNKIEYTLSEDVAKETAEFLADDNLVGWFQGRLEFGPRALGNRSILANPTDLDSRNMVNENVKNRANWRPFAPSLLSEAKTDYFEHNWESPFMILTDDVSDEKQDEIPATTHVDQTARPQTVRRDQNRQYYDLLCAFRELTGVPVLLNTSFNKSGEPIVESPEQALSDFFTSGLDVLVIEDYIIRK